VVLLRTCKDKHTRSEAKEREREFVLLQKPKRTIVSRENEQPVKREEQEKKREREAEREST
jgi:hypothetical protein